MEKTSKFDIGKEIYLKDEGDYISVRQQGKGEIGAISREEVSKFKKYGQLANLDMKGMISSVRIDNDEYEKDQVADFALWKAYDKESD